MKKLLLLLALPFTALCQDFPDGMVAVEFNASFNKANEVTWLNKLTDCKTSQIDIATDKTAQSKYKIVVVPTIIVFNQGEEVKRYQANIMMQIEAKLEDIQHIVDETVMESF